MVKEPKKHLANAHGGTYCGAYGAWEQEPATANIVDVTCARCRSYLAKLAGLKRTAPIQMVVDKLQEMELAKPYVQLVNKPVPIMRHLGMFTSCGL